MDISFSESLRRDLCDAFNRRAAHARTLVIEFAQDVDPITVPLGIEVRDGEWHADPVRLEVPKHALERTLRSWTVFDDDWLPVFEGRVGGTRIGPHERATLNLTLDATLDIPSLPTLLVS